MSVVSIPDFLWNPLEQHVCSSEAMKYPEVNGIEERIGVGDQAEICLREMTINDHPTLVAFWATIEGLSIDESDSYENMVTFLNRNPRLSYVATINNEIVGTIKGAQDGRRGYLSHMAVSPGIRSSGIAKMLYERAIAELRNQGIWRCNLYVLDSNPGALSFWKHNGWAELEDNFRMLQRKL